MKDFDELHAIGELTKIEDSLIRCREIARVEHLGDSFPIHSFEIGSTDPAAPVLALFGGVHGLEKVGTQVVVTYLSSLFKQLSWDEELRRSLEKYRIISIPLINPWGMYHHRRSNANDVDLMRNAPVKALEKKKFLLSGQRITTKLPWYQGEENAPMEKELQALVDYCKEHIFEAKRAISVDFHSGFGLKDRLWFPYSKTLTPFKNIVEMENLEQLLNETHPHHIYKVEPTAESYTIEGDVWDYLYDEYCEKNPDGVYIPLTLEMGSWIWVKKNPLQIFRRDGLFNPMKSHRYDRTMRRHIMLIKFLFRAVGSSKAWVKENSL